MTETDSVPIIDSHSHAWPRWPYQPPVPDDEHRGRIEQLLYEMDVQGVDAAVIICAQIDHNPDNNAYVMEQAAQYPGRFYPFADVDCVWSPTYHTPGAAGRLRGIAERWPIKGFTHYLSGKEDGSWLTLTPVLKFSIISDGPPTSQATTGLPQAHASRVIIPKGSLRDGTHTRSQALKRSIFSCSDTYPSTLILSWTPR